MAPTFTNPATGQTYGGEGATLFGYAAEEVAFPAFLVDILDDGRVVVDVLLFHDEEEAERSAHFSDREVRAGVARKTTDLSGGEEGERCPAGLCFELPPTEEGEKDADDLDKDDGDGSESDDPDGNGGDEGDGETEADPADPEDPEDPPES